MSCAIKSERSIASRLGPLVLSALAHGALGAAIVCARVDAPKRLNPAVDVTLPERPLPPLPPAGQAARMQRTPRPPTPKVAAQVLVQPRPLPVLEKLPDSPTTTGATDEGEESGEEGGVIGGVIGGLAGGQPGGEIGTSRGPPVLLGAGMTRPIPRGECSVSGTRPRPITPEQARRMSITGTVLVEYTVHPDGSVGEISMRNNGPPILFGAVKKWLEECSFSPSLSGVKPIPVKVIQPFVFQMKG